MTDSPSPDLAAALERLEARATDAAMRATFHAGDLAAATNDSDRETARYCMDEDAQEAGDLRLILAHLDEVTAKNKSATETVTITRARYETYMDYEIGAQALEARAAELQGMVGALAEALKPFAALEDAFGGHDPAPNDQTWTLTDGDGTCLAYDLTPGDFRRAAATLLRARALTPGEKEGGG